ncbi:MAG: HPr family phosphocarrier protein [Ruminococcaceae bacterium]|nr:HPr family phosphocarrier protein [Oscillospiraceae bacterium]
MTQRDVTITNNIGLHARPATFFIQKANSFKSSIWIEKDDRKVNAKSLLGVLSMGIAKGMTVTLIADGQDEATAINSLVELVQTGFAE